MTSFTDQIAVVTGASSGIGKAIALSLAVQGTNLGLVGRKVESLEVIAESARKVAPRVLSYRADLTVEEDIRELAADLQRDFGCIDILVHSAGAISLGKIETAPVQDLDFQYRTNVRAPYVLTQSLLPLIRSRQGQIVFINSSAGLSGRANAGQYSATKHALKAVADSLREEVNADGLRVLSMFLGRTATPMQAALHELEGRPYNIHRLMQPEDVATVVMNALTLPRTAEVTDVSMRPLKKPAEGREAVI